MMQLVMILILFSPATRNGLPTCDISQSEVSYKVVPPAILEPKGDIASGPSGGFTDIVKTIDGSGLYVYSDVPAIAGTIASFTGTARLYLDGTLIGSKALSNPASWSIAANSSYSNTLYTAGVLTVSSRSTTGAGNNSCWQNEIDGKQAKAVLFPYRIESCFNVVPNHSNIVIYVSFNSDCSQAGNIVI